MMLGTDERHYILASIEQYGVLGFGLGTAEPQVTVFLKIPATAACRSF